MFWCTGYSPRLDKNTCEWTCWNSLSHLWIDSISFSLCFIFQKSVSILFLFNRIRNQKNQWNFNFLYDRLESWWENCNKTWLWSSWLLKRPIFILMMLQTTWIEDSWSQWLLLRLRKYLLVCVYVIVQHQSFSASMRSLIRMFKVFT